MWKHDITRWLWWGVVFVLLYDGVTHAASGTLWGRLKGAGLTPVAEGWPVVALGVLEAGIGLFAGYRLLRRRPG